MSRVSSLSPGSKEFDQGPRGHGALTLDLGGDSRPEAGTKITQGKAQGRERGVPQDGARFVPMPGEPEPRNFLRARYDPTSEVGRMGLDQQAEAALGRLRLSRLLMAIEEMTSLSRRAPPDARAEALGAAKFVLRPLGLDKIV
ncbi:hypothetical protein ACM25N_01380 [Roseovarius sp. C7]|uniref:hypothetical protein n=1 Tax=Roseovarius sp. C7 TaxID=3398643 RepID=UPI0039F62A60